MIEAIVYRRRFHTVAETYFAAEPPRVKADVLELIQSPVPVPRARCIEFYSLLLDLRESHEALWQGMTKNTRYEVRRAAERDGVVYHPPCSATAAALQRFLDLYEVFANRKGLPGLDPSRLQAHAAARVLHLSVVQDPDGHELVWHAYFRGDDRVRLLHSASLLDGSADQATKALLGRANRFHHWQDLLHFQSEGVSTYDFGGWYHGRTDREKLGINAFKESFGGRVSRDFNCTLARSPAGVAVLGARRMRSWGAARRRASKS